MLLPEVSMKASKQNTFLSVLLLIVYTITYAISFTWETPIAFYYYGMTAKEIGQRAGLSKNAVEKRLKRGLEKLKTVLQSEHDQLA